MFKTLDDDLSDGKSDLVTSTYTIDSCFNLSYSWFIKVTHLLKSLFDAFRFKISVT